MLWSKVVMRLVQMTLLGESRKKQVDFTEANKSGAGFSSSSVGNFTAVSPSCVWPVAVQDVQHTGGVSGFNIVLVGSPNGLSILCPRDEDPGAASVCAHEFERLAD